MAKSFESRFDAAQMLYMKLGKYVGIAGTEIVAYTREGVPVADALADRLHDPAFYYFTEQITSDHYPGESLGAVGEHNIAVYNEKLIKKRVVSIEEGERSAAEAKARMLSEAERLDPDRHPAVENRFVLLVSDIIQEGFRAQAAIMGLKKFDPIQIVVAAPFISSAAIRLLRNITTHIIYIRKVTKKTRPENRYRIYRDVTDDFIRDYVAADRPVDHEQEERIIV